MLKLDLIHSEFVRRLASEHEGVSAFNEALNQVLENAREAMLERLVVEV